MALFADSTGPDQTVRMRRVIWAFAVRIFPKPHFLHGAANLMSVILSLVLSMYVIGDEELIKNL